MTMPEASPAPVAKWLYPEYCPGPLFWGWWLYLRDRNDGSANDNGRWGWVRDGWRLVAVCDLLRGMGRADVPALPPYPHGDTSVFAEWFAAAFPAGIRVRVLPTDSPIRVRYEPAPE